MIGIIEVSMAGLTVLLLLWLGYFSYRRQTRQLALRRSQGVDASARVLQLVKAVQQHRGISSAVLGGDESKRYQLQGLEVSIHQQMQALEPLLPLDDPSPWNQVQSKWAVLKAGESGADVLKNFDAHCDLLAELLSLVQDITDHCALTSACDPQERALAQQIFDHLPKVTENLGQLRALGTHAAARRDCITSSRLHLQFLIDQLSRQQRRHEGSLAEQISGVLTLISEQVLQPERIDVAADEIFQSITGVMERCYRDIDQGVQQLGQPSLVKP